MYEAIFSLLGRTLFWIISIAACWIFYIFWNYKKLRKNGRTMPAFYDDLSFLHYLVLLRSFYHQSLPPLCLLFQAINGVSKMFYKEGMFAVWVPFRPYVVIHNADLIKMVINHPDALDKAAPYGLMTCLFGDGLLLSNGKKWFHRRKLISPAFHMDILKSYVTIFNEQSQRAVERLKDLIDLPWVDIDELISQCSLGILCDSAMGYKLDFRIENKDAESYLHLIHNCAEVVIHRALRPWTQNDGLFFNCFSAGRKFVKIIHPMKSFTKKVIEEKKTSVMKDKKIGLNTDVNDNFKPGKYKKAFLEMMINYHLNDSTFTLEDIQEEVDTFMAAGHDTTALTVRWAIYLLGLHPDVQEKVLLEQKSLFADDPHRLVTFDDICNMKYTECAIKETMRLYPPLPIVAREALKDIQIGPYTVPKSSYIAMNIYMLHRDPKIFPDPEKYQPERFLTENSLGRHPYAFLPFSAGPRNCIGQKFAMMSIKVQLSHLLRNFKVTSLDRRDEVNLNWELTLINAKSLRVKFTPR